MRVYLDACCLSRLTDNQDQPRIRGEAIAVVLVLGWIQEGSVQWIASEALAEEIRRNYSPERRMQNEALLAKASVSVAIDHRIEKRGRELQSLGYGMFDALHLAAAEAKEVDVLLSTDDRFIRQAARGTGRPRVPVRNPVSWVQERAQEQSQ
jgi:predicted nucleic acid-binding protein